MMSEPELLGYSTIDKAQPVPSSDEDTMTADGDSLPPVENQESVTPVNIHIPDNGSSNGSSPPPYTPKDMDGPNSHQNAIYENGKKQPEDQNGKPRSENGKPAAVDLPLEEIPLGSEAGKDKEEAKKDEPQQLVSLGQLFRFADGWDWLLMIIGSLCALGHGAALPAMLVVFGEMTDSFVATGAADNLNMTQQIEIFDQLLDEMATYSLYYVGEMITGIACGVLLAGYAQVGLWLVTSYRQIQRVRERLFTAILKQDIGWFDTTDVGELNTRLSDDVNKIREGIGDKIGNFLQWMSTFLTGFIIGFVKGWKLALVIVSISPLLAACGGIMAYLISSVTKKELDAYAKAGSVAEEVLSSIRTVFAFSGQKKECERYSSHLDSARKFGLKKGMAGGGGMGLIFFIIFCCYALAFWYGAKLVREEPHNYTLGTMLIVFFCVVMGAFGIGNALPNIQNVATARGAAFSLWKIIDRDPPIDSSSDDGIVPDKLEGHIQLKDVHFAYPSRPDVPVLQGVNMEARVGQTVALVGSSGCGKSTIVQLILRFYDALSGSVLLDGQPVDKLNIKWLRGHIGLVSQEPVLFGTTIEENIRYGSEGVTKEQIEQAAREANAYNFIMELPHKFETLVGERGAQLSGGQKQRIAIARALVRNPRILLLDEATSALDTESEHTVQAALDEARHGRTTLVIAHRLSTIKNAHVIFGFDQGVVTESGTHEKLMSEGGIYYKLVTNQQVMMEDDEEDEVIEAEKVDMHRLDSTRVSVRRQRSMSIMSHSEKEKKLPEIPMSRILKLNVPEWYYIALGCLAAIVHGGIQPAFAIIFTEIIGVFALPVNEQEDEVFFYCMMFIVIGITAALAMFFQGFLFSISGEALTMRVRQMVFEALMRQDVSFFDDHDNNTGALTTRLSTEASAIQGATGARFGTVLQTLAAVGTGVVIGFIFSWKLTLVILAFVPFILAAGMLQMKLMMGYSGGGQEALEGAGKVAIEAVENMRTVASLTLEPKFAAKYKQLTLKPHKDSMRMAHFNGITFAFSQSIMFFAYAACFYFGAWLIRNDGLSFVNMFRVFSAIVFGAMAMGQASHFAPDYGKAKSAASRIFALLEKETSIDSSSKDGLQPSGCGGNIEFTKVNFCYPTRPTVPVLHDLDLQVNQGQMVALVGSSGCGKSTTVQLVERFYDPLSGSVKLDGNELTELNVGWLRSHMAIVAQEPVLFGCSIRDNIAYGDNSTDVDMSRIIQAARDANIHNFIDSLPEGYDTNVGERGAQLSGGQKQRIAIARALVRNPRILLLDEATSALDTESEKVVQEALDRAQQGRTSLVIAHRLSTIQNADCIVVFHRGKVSEMGTHAELLAKKGTYYKLSNVQMKRAS